MANPRTLSSESCTATTERRAGTPTRNRGARGIASPHIEGAWDGWSWWWWWRGAVPQPTFAAALPPRRPPPRCRRQASVAAQLRARGLGVCSPPPIDVGCATESRIRSSAPHEDLCCGQCAGLGTAVAVCRQQSIAALVCRREEVYVGGILEVAPALGGGGMRAQPNMPQVPDSSP